jgi:excinuclease ABC subunit C
LIKKPERTPSQPGVYLFKSRQGDILYIGKAKNLKARIAQYFQTKDDPVLKNLLKQSEEIEYILTDDEKDALHLEYNLIQIHQPPFNIRLKDDKSFPSIEITIQDTFPGVYYSRRFKPGSTVFGPVADAKSTKVLIDLITRIFKLRTCSASVFKKGVACLYFYIDRCSGPCIQKIDQIEYNRQVRDAVNFLKGERRPTIQRLEARMKAHAQVLEFEKAQQIKEDLDLIRDFRLESYISSSKKVDFDAIALHLEDNHTWLVQFSVVAGRVSQREIFSFTNFSKGREEILKDFLVSNYTQKNIPPEIVVPFDPADAFELENLFTILAGKKVRLKVPLRGIKKKMLELTIKNLNDLIEKTSFPSIAEHLETSLNLKRSPNHIEGYDISHLSERERVGAVVVFINGNPARSLYRNYLIKSAGPGDTEALKEVLQRRFKNIKQHPDLLLIDGGKPQLGAAKEIKKRIGLKSDIVALAKREERVFLENGGSVILPDDSSEKFLFQSIRDEAHRRANTHHRTRREKMPG